MASFLQGIVTCDVESAAECVYGLMLTPKGRLLCDLFIYKDVRGVEFLLETSRCNAEVLIKTLSLYNFKKTVIIREEAHLSYVGLPRIIDAAPGKMPIVDANEKAIYDEYLHFSEQKKVTNSTLSFPQEFLFCVGDPRDKDLGLRVVSPGCRMQTSDACYGQYELTRIIKKVPETGKELNVNVFPLNYGMEYAFDFNKGCYVGQEVISRFRLRNLIDQSLFCVQAEPGVSLKEGGEISSNGEVLGYFSSCSQNYGLALLKNIVRGENAYLQYKTNKLILS